ncbi:protein decapping 5-like [Typha latifolia]|uniref:protein decapping 5-like n=1 Tax=Typha latifolia TaxID=4733 RepID=UPI003C2F2B55
MASEIGSSSGSSASDLGSSLAAILAFPPETSCSLAESYVGRLIGIITTSGIRYEGCINHLDRNAGTILLDQVRHFGTEGRKEDGPQIPPSSCLYDYISFRASEIKEVQELGTAFIPEQTLMKDDPAIIEAYLTSDSSSNHSDASSDGRLGVCSLCSSRCTIQ